MTHDERMHQLLYSNEGRVELCERICKLEDENASLREAIVGLWPRAAFTMHGSNRESWVERLHELDVEVPDA